MKIDNGRYFIGIFLEYSKIFVKGFENQLDNLFIASSCYPMYYVVGISNLLSLPDI